MWLLIHAGLQLIHVSKRGPRRNAMSVASDKYDQQSHGSLDIGFEIGVNDNTNASYQLKSVVDHMKYRTGV